MTLGILCHAGGFADGVARDNQIQDILSDLELRCGFFERVLFVDRRLLLRTGPAPTPLPRRRLLARRRGLLRGDARAH